MKDFLSKAIWVILALAVVAIVLVAAQVMGVPIPGWAMTIFWIVVVAAVCIFAIKFLAGAANK